MVGGVWVDPPAVHRGQSLEDVAIVAEAKRDVLLRAHRFRLRREDLEDCYSQAVLELMLRIRRGGSFAGGQIHLANALEQRFQSRIQDRRRALSGRSPIEAALEGARPLGGGEEAEVQIVDRRAELEQLVILRAELRSIEALVWRLTSDQRLALAAQLGEVSGAELRARYGWSVEKYRKVGQRARARLRALLSEQEASVPPRANTSEEGAGTGS